MIQPELPGMPPIPAGIARIRRKQAGQQAMRAQLGEEVGGGAGLARRMEARKVARAARRSMGKRLLDDNMGEPEVGLQDEIGFGRSQWGRDDQDIPAWASYHGSTNTSWSKMPVQEVPTPTLLTPQKGVSPSRLQELIEHPERRGVREARGLTPEYPKVYRDEGGRDHLVDGNHRMAADRLRGQMFAPARVAQPTDEETFYADSQRIEFAKDDAKERRFNESDWRHDPEERYEEMLYPPGGSWEQREQELKEKRRRERRRPY